MKTSALLVSTAMGWFGTARIPRGLAKAGFEVALLTPPNSLAEKSRYVGKVAYLPNNATPRDWLFAFATSVKATAPSIVIPCDDVAFRLLAWLALLPPGHIAPELQMQLVTLIRESLGDPSHYQASVDKTLLPPVAETLGVRVPPYAIVADLTDAEEFAVAHGYPVVLKRGHGFAGQGVVICADRSEIARAFAGLASADAEDSLGASGGRYLIQAYVHGPIQYFHAAAWRGDLVAGWALEKLIANPAPMGPPTVTRYFRSPALREVALTLAKSMGISGLFFAEFIVDPRSGAPLLLEINRRVSPATHRGEARNVDFCAALYAAIHGTASTSRSELGDGEEGISVHFPQEWLRNPDSHYLGQYPSDVPWDEPDLMEAFLAMRQ